MRHVVEAQQMQQQKQKDQNAYQLACLSYQYTHRAAVVALEEAARDVVRAHVPKRVHWVDDDISIAHPKRARSSSVVQ